MHCSLEMSDKATVTSRKASLIAGHPSGDDGTGAVLCSWPVVCDTIGTRCVGAAGL